MAETPRSAVVLNVGDDEAARAALSAILRRSGYEAREASSGGGAIPTRVPPDAVILETELPDVTAAEVVRRLRGKPALSDIPILLLAAAETSPTVVTAALESGVDACLRRPVDEQVLLAQVAALLRRRRLEQGLNDARAGAESRARESTAVAEELRGTRDELEAANERLRTSKEDLARQLSLLQGIIDGMPAAVLVKDREGRFVTINTELERLFGLSREQVRGKMEHEFLPPPAAARHEEHDRRVLESGVPEQIEEEADLADGRHTFLANKVPLRDDAGAVRAMCGIAVDITARKQAEEALRESERRLREVQHIAGIGNWVWYLRTGEARWSPETYTMFGLDLERPALAPEALIEQVHPEDRVRVSAAIARAVSDGTPAELDYRIVRPDGAVRTIHAVGAVTEFDAEGKPAVVLGTNQDITERVQAEEERERLLAEVRQQRSFLAAFLDNAPTAMAYLDTELRYVRVNRAYADWMVLPPEQLIGRTHLEITGIEERTKTLREVLHTGQPARRHEVPVSCARWTERPDRHIDYAVFPVKDASGWVVGVVLSLEDATERVEQRERMLAAERARAELAEILNREIAHRTKNNLAMAAGLLQVQARQQSDPQVGAALAEALARLTTLASVQEEMQHTTTEARVDLPPVLHRIGSASAGVFRRGEVVVSVTGEESLVLSSKVATHLAVVANELITNAIKHGAPGPDGKLRVEVELVPEDESVKLCVWNSGNPVCENFDAARQQGMGLQLVRDLVMGQYQGRFSVHPDRGGTSAEVVTPLEQLRRMD